MNATVVQYGDQAVLVSVADAHAAALLAAKLRDALPVEKVTDVVPADGSVLVTGPGATSLEATIAAVAATVQAADRLAGREVVIPVVYNGPDLADVAATLGMSPEAVVAAHTSGSYTVDFLGFAPGFPYLSGLNPKLSVPRRATPRTIVPAGSVGLASGKTCVYPTASPGGWQLIGTAATPLFDAANDLSPAVLAAGDRVRFEAVR